MKKLDFAIIGAQKCATTALHALLSEHPGVAMPRNKEAPFFDRADAGRIGWLRFVDEHFSGADRRALWGKASPQYMAGTGVATRLARANPWMRIIAIVRDPIARAHSQYQMAVRRELEERSFEEAVAPLLAPAALDVGRAQPAPRHAEGYESEAPFYLAWSEYGRILQSYRAAFPASQLLVVEQRALRERPAETLDRILAFLGLPTGFRPASLGQEVHRGGSRRVIGGGAKRRLLAVPGVRRLWHTVPAGRREWLRFLVDQWNVRPGSREAMTLSPGMRRRLRQHFAADLVRFERAVGFPAPWADAYREPVSCEAVPCSALVADCNG